MKKNISLLLILIFFGILTQAQTTYIPDDNFEQALIDLGYDDVLDDYVLTANISGVFGLNLSDKEISDLTGIEDFVSITSLNCENNNISSVDLSHNTNLVYLTLSYNSLTSLDLSNNTALKGVNCQNNQLNELNVTQNSLLDYLTCCWNQLPNLDVSQNTSLTSLSCFGNQIASLDVTQNTALLFLSCFQNKIPSLDLSQNTALTHLLCNVNLLTSLDLSQNSALQYLICHHNQLTELNIQNGNNANISTFDATSNASLVCIQVDDELIVNSGFPPYDSWQKDATTSYAEDCENYGLSYVPDDNFEQALIDLGYDDVLDDFVVTADISGITSLDVSNNNIADLTGIETFIGLTNLACYNNQLTSLDVSQNANLEDLDCHNNQLTELNARSGNNDILITFDATSNTSLNCIQVDDELNANAGLPPYDSWQIDAAAHYSEDCSGLDRTYVPDNNFEQALIDLGYDDVLDDFVLTDNISGLDTLKLINKDIADLTGIEGFTSLTYLLCNENNLQELDISQNLTLTFLGCNDNYLTDLDLSQNADLELLGCGSNQLTSLDLSNNIKLTYVNCTWNNITSLDFSNNPDVSRIFCGSNQLTSLNLTGTPALTYINCQRNDLASLDLTQNPELGTLQCDNNLFSVLDVTHNPALDILDCHENLLTNLDLTQNTVLRWIECYSNQLTSLDLSKNEPLYYIRCENNLLESLDVSNGNNASVSYFSATNNPSLACITVDDFRADHSSWMVDPGVTYSNYCGFVVIPDANFEQALLDQGLDSDGILNQLITDTDAGAITVLDISNLNISDLSGIESFPNLTSLNCSDNNLTYLDLSLNQSLEEIYCSRNQLEELIIGTNPNLEILKCNSNQLTYMPGSYYASMIEYDCSDNQFEILSINTGPSLVKVNCSDNNIHTLIFANQSSVLSILDCSNNQFTSGLNISQCTSLTELNCSNSQLTALDVSQNTLLQVLHADGNQISGIELEQCSSLAELNCSSNELTQLDLSQINTITSIDCSHNLLTSLDLQNGNNGNITFVNATQNILLSCINVDDATAANAGLSPYDSWLIDEEAAFSEDCQPDDRTYVPGTNFEQALIDLGYDDVLDNYVQTSSISAIKSLYVTGKDITDLTGIEDFISLTWLGCDENHLHTLDVSRNIALTSLNCNNNYLTSLDISQNTALASLDCSENELTVLDISQNTGLKYLTCDRNELTSLDVSQHTSLLRLRCSSNPLSSLDVSQNTLLESLYCEYNQLSSLDVSQNILLQYLCCRGNQLTSLDITHHPELKYLLITSNELTNIDLTQNAALYHLECGNNPLANLDLSQNTLLEFLSCDYNEVITNLDLSNNPQLEYLSCGRNNSLTSLDLSQNPSLTELHCSYSDLLSSLNLQNGNNGILIEVGVVQNPVLTCIQVDNETDAKARIYPYSEWDKDWYAVFSEDCEHLGQTNVPDDNFEQVLIDLGYDDILDDWVITANISGVNTLDVSSGGITDMTGIQDFASLTALACQDNGISNLDLRQNTQLTSLNCSSNQLTNLDVRNGNNQSISVFNATNNSLLTCIQVDYEAEANAGLPPYDTWQKDASTSYSSNCFNPGYTYVPDDQFELALIAMGYDDVQDDYVLTATIAEITYMDVSDRVISDLRGIQDFVNLRSLYCQENELTQLNVSQNTALAYLNCERNELTSLDVSQNTSLISLRCSSNPLYVLDVSQNPLLTTLYCEHNELTSLDVSQNTALEYLGCRTNQLTSLDLTQHPSMRYLLISYNELTEIDLTQNPAIFRLECGGNQLTSLDLSQNTLLEYLSCSDNDQLLSLDVSHNPNLEKLYCYRNELLSSANVQNGNNEILLDVWLQDNPYLTCIQVDNETDAKAGLLPYSEWEKEWWAVYSEDCEHLGQTNVPDDNFEQALIDLGYDDILDDWVITANISGVSTLDVSSQDITDMTGIQDFASLTVLACQDNGIFSLDLRQNTQLTSLNCSSNQLTNLDVRNGNNESISIFNATNNPLLTCIQVDYEAEAVAGLPPYDTWQKDASTSYSSNCFNPGYTYVPDDQFEMALIEKGYDDVMDDYVLTTSISELTYLDVAERAISDLRGIQDFAGLRTLHCEENQLTSLNISQNTALSYLDCARNNITSLDVSELTSLSTLRCFTNLITDLDVSQNLILQYLTTENNPLGNLDVSQNTALIMLNCRSNQLASLDLSNNAALDRLYCSSNQLTEIDLSYNSALTLLECSSNQLTNLDVSQNVLLENITCEYNDLTSLDVSQNPNLEGLYCRRNEPLVFLNAQNGNNEILVRVWAQYNPALTCIQVDNAANATARIFPYNGWYKDYTASYSEACIQPDTEPPVLSGIPDDLTVACDAIPAPATVTAEDNVDGPVPVVFDELKNPGICEHTYTLVRTWSATDAAGNTASAEQIITVEDTEAPAITPPADITVLCNESVDPALTGMASATDNCDAAPVITYADVEAAGSCPQEYTITRTWTATDACSNAGSAEQLIFVADDEAPMITPPADITVFCNESVDPAVTGMATATDNCDEAPLITYTDVETVGSCPQEYTITRTWIATDACGNVSSADQVITVEDSQVPELTVPDDITVDCNASTNPAETGQATATDNCDVAPEVTYTDVETAGSCPQEYTITRTWTVTDACGNVSSADQVISVFDTEAPVLPTAPSSITVDCIDDVPTAVSLTAEDNCVGYITEEPVEEIIEGSCINDFVLVRTWTFTDDCGNTSEVSQTISVNDTEAPVPPTPPANVTVSCIDDVPAAVNLTAEDNCVGLITAEPVDEITEGSCINDFVLTRTWTFTDDCGNTSSVSQTISVNDTEAPVPPAPPANVTVSCIDDVPAAVNLTAEDNCVGYITAEPVDEITEGSCINDFILVRTWTFTDGCGNTSSVSQTITVNDNTPPVIQEISEVIQENELGLCGAYVDYMDITATDNCVGEVILTSNLPSGSFFPVGSTIVTVTATDVCGNSSTAPMVITVNDTEPPSMVPPDFISQSNDPGSCDAVVTLVQPEVTDNCGNVSINSDAPPEFPIGQTIVTWTADDGHGNQSTTTSVVEITNLPVPPNEPIISAPIDPIIINMTIDISATSTDNNIQSAIWDWGHDQETSEASIIYSITGTEFLGQHSYEEAGVYTITLTVAECDGATASSMYQYVVVYDPAGGFITGGGWIWSPPGAYVDDPPLEGKANFGFVAKYKKGASVPDGNTEFQFKAGDLNFKSTLYDWLVIAGAKAKFKGEGTINEVGTYGFMLSAIDGDLKDDVDRFRIKIWDKADNDQLVYDNEFESDETADPSTTLGGGSIVIHNPKEKDARDISHELTGVPAMIIYPNPAEDYLNIFVSGPEDEYIELKLFNAIGELIHYSEGKGALYEELSVSAYKPGMYIVTTLIGDILLRQNVLIK